MMKADYIVTEWETDVDYSWIKLPMIVVTENPSDYPGQVVARLWDALSGPTNVIKRYEKLRDVGPTLPGWAKLSPDKYDDPVIKEIYLR
jgi:hypothetical protein